jgi:hypothetical protein
MNAFRCLASEPKVVKDDLEQAVAEAAMEQPAVNPVEIQE